MVARSTARKKRKGELPSGNIRIKVYDYTDERGKKHYKSFTAGTKAEANAMADEWRNGKGQEEEGTDRKTVQEACEDYIELRKAVLSPSTVTGYRAYARALSNYKLGQMDIRKISGIDIQMFVSLLSARYSPKYVKNISGLISAALSVYLPDFDANIAMPKAKKSEMYIPNKKDVQKLLDNCETPEAKLGILFAAVGTMRRGEACAVEFKDVDYKAKTIRINKSMVYLGGNQWGAKAPKTYESNRIVRMPDYVFRLIKDLDRTEGRILGLDPNQLYKRFRKALKKAGLPGFRYHDLRHYAASSLHAAGVPERYIEAIGGWQPGSTVLKRVYENVMDSEMERIRNMKIDSQQFEI